MADVLSPGLSVAETYEVERLLGRGGMGEVWLARHVRLAGKHVAIKVLHTQGALPPEALSRFRREAEIAAKLEHPNIVQVIDFNSLPTGQPYIVMEYLKGESLASRLQRGPLRVDEARQLVRQIGSALHAAHTAGVVHRDLKPENIHLIPTGLGDQVKVLDFGISKLTDSQTMQTSDAVLMGTPLYMSPEQALGHNSDVTAQSDVFSLGSMAYECLTGSAPFAADTVAKVVFRIAYEPHPPLRNRLPGIDASVEQAIEHALQKDRAKRTATVAVFVLEFTGEVLTSASQSPVRNVSGGLLTPGMAVDEQMMSSATAAPSQGAARATPARQSDGPAVVPPSARRLGVLALALGAVVVGGSLAAWVIARTTTSLSHDSTGDSTSELRARAVVDSGASADALVTVASDSGAAPVPLPADRGGDHQADAGTAPKPIPAPPPSKSDRALLAPLEEQVKKGQADAVWNARIGTEARLNSSGGLREYAVLMVEVACARKDVGAANMFFRKLESAGPRDAARKRCRKHADFELSY